MGIKIRFKGCWYDMDSLSESDKELMADAIKKVLPNWSKKEDKKQSEIKKAFKKEED